MAFFARKRWNEHRVVIQDGASIHFSSNGKFLYVRDAHGVTIARFNTMLLEEHWLEVDGVRTSGGAH